MKIYLILVLILASLLRLFALADFPSGFNADEASLGYNAYSILQTGKDEYGSTFPLVLKSFGDYKPALYAYLTIPFVAILGLNELAVRLPSALLGIATVYLIFLLGRKIFKNELVGLSSAFLLAISPWHLHFSRGAWETNAATFFITLGVYLFLLGLKKYNFLFFSLISFLASIYTYQSPKLIVPVFLLLLAFFYKDKLKLMHQNIKVKQAFISVLILMLLSLPIFLQFVSGQGAARFSGLSSFADPGPINRINELRGEHAVADNFEVKLLHNKLTAFIPNFLGHYLDHFRGDFLFINGDPLIRNKVPETGQFYIIYCVFLIVGLIVLTRNQLEHAKLLIIWILVAPLASSITYQTPHALRALNIVVPLTLVMGYGLLGILRGLERLRSSWRKVLVGVIVIILSFEFIHYLENYYIHYPKRYPVAWEYGFSEMVSKLNRVEKSFNKVVITDKYDQPYILILFYKKYDPEKYHPQAFLTERDKFNFGTVRSFDRYEFRAINPNEIDRNPGTLYVGSEKEIPENANIIDRVYFPNGEVAFIFAGIRKEL